MAGHGISSALMPHQWPALVRAFKDPALNILWKNSLQAIQCRRLHLHSDAFYSLVHLSCDGTGHRRKLRYIDGGHRMTNVRAI